MLEQFGSKTTAAFAESLRTRSAYLAVLLMIGLALLALLSPALAARLLGLGLLEAHGLSEIRSSYGAFFLVMGGSLLWALANRPKGAPYVRLSGFLWAGAALGRLLSIFLDGAFLPANFLMLALELFIAVPLLLAGFQTPKLDALDGPSPLDAYRT